MEISREIALKNVKEYCQKNNLFIDGWKITEERANKFIFENDLHNYDLAVIKLSGEIVRGFIDIYG